jgi:D-alanyl-D-alanine carboxypeptidase-like protein
MANMHLERLDGLQPQVREKALAAFKQGGQEGLGIMVTSALRTFAEQAELFAQGRTKPGKGIVTNARPGQSYHNFGLAFDFVVMQGTKAIWNQNHPQWKRFVKIAKGHGLEWGGDWKNFPDYPHFQLASAPSLTSLRSKYPQGFKPGASVTVATWVTRDQRPLKKGHKDGTRKLVSQLQKRLGIKPDGYFGKGTDKAVREWQAVHNEKGEVAPKGKGLAANGHVDNKTWGALFAGPS